MSAHRSGASSLTLDNRDRAASKTARMVCPLVRSIAAAYDPEHDGVQPDEVREMLCACATSREDAARVEELVGACGALDAERGAVAAEALCDVLKDPRHAALLAEIFRQLGEYQARVGDQFMAGLGLKNAASSQRHGRRGAVAVALDGGLEVAHEHAPIGLKEVVEQSLNTTWR